MGERSDPEYGVDCDRSKGAEVLQVGDGYHALVKLVVEHVE